MTAASPIRAVAAHPQPGLRGLLEARRDPLAQARVELTMAEADMNGLVAQLAAGTLPQGDVRALARTLRDRVHAARERLDLVRFDLLEVVRVNGSTLAGNDPDDLIDALFVGIERVEDGRWHERHERPREVVRLDEHNWTAADHGIARSFVGRV